MSKMRYQSTRGGIKNLTFEEALLSGYLADSGICLPECFPQVLILFNLVQNTFFGFSVLSLGKSEKLKFQIDRETLSIWSKMSYPELVKAVMALYISEDEVPSESINGT